MLTLTEEQFQLAKKTYEPLLDDPEIRRLVYPRIYRDAGQYMPIKDLAILILGNLMTPDRQQVEGDFESLLREWVAAMARHHWPTYFIAPDFFDAVRRTDFPAGFDPAELKVPFPAGRLMFPRPNFTHSSGSWFGTIGWQAAFDRLLLITASLHCGFLWAIVTREMLRDLSTIPDGADLSEHEVPEEVWKDPEKLAPYLLNSFKMNADDKAVLHEAIRVFVNVMLLMEARPDYVSSGRMEKRVVKAGRVTEFWTPNLIGRDYRIIRQPASKGAVETGVRRRPHWVRGHLRNQPCGPKWQDRKIIWIEPYYCG